MSTVQQHCKSSVTGASTGVLWARVIGFTGLFAVAAFLFHPYGVICSHFMPQISGFPKYAIWAALGLAMGTAFAWIVWLVGRVERPRNWRTLFRIGPPDLLGMFLYWAFALAFSNLSRLFLKEWLWNPAQRFLESLGLPGEAMGASVPAHTFHVSPVVALVGLILLLLTIWTEVPEEILFRGYVQNQLQGRYGKIAALCMAMLLWDVMHIFAPANFVERFFIGACTVGLVFALRQNVTPVAIMHPLCNRADEIGVVFLQIFGVDVTERWYGLVDTVSLWVLALISAGIWMSLSRHRLPKQDRDHMDLNCARRAIAAMVPTQNRCLLKQRMAS
jgi:membrane protease YdiL (CAAX protease family)